MAREIIPVMMNTKEEISQSNGDAKYQELEKKIEELEKKLEGPTDEK